MQHHANSQAIRHEDAGKGLGAVHVELLASLWPQKLL